MQLFFFDTETTWFPERGWRIIQFGAIYGFYDLETKTFYEERRINQFINCNTESTPAAFAVHGITKEKISKFKYIDSYIKEFLAYMHKSDRIIAHNVAFDMKMLKSEMAKLGIEYEFHTQTFCTMHSTKAYMNLWGKPPKLSELYQKVFGKNFDNAHDAMADIEATKDCFCELLKIGEIVL